MSDGKWWLGDGPEEMFFKRVQDGWLFVTPFPWSRTTYLIDDTQKIELSRRLRWIYRANLIAVVLAVCFLAPMSHSASTKWLAIAALSAVSFGLTTIAVRLAASPIISGLTSVSASISRKDAIVAQARTLPYAAIATMIVVSLVLFASAVGLAVTSGWSDSITIMSVILFGACSVYFPVLWIVKARTESA
jgi:hypothetical protein